MGLNEYAVTDWDLESKKERSVYECENKKTYVFFSRVGYVLTSIYIYIWIVISLLTDYWSVS